MLTRELANQIQSEWAVANDMNASAIRRGPASYKGAVQLAGAGKGMWDYSGISQAILTTPSGAFNGQEFEGIVTDYAPRYGLDRDAEHPAGKSLNVIQLFNDLLLSVEYLYERLKELKTRTI